MRREWPGGVLGGVLVLTGCRYLALVALLREEDFDKHGLIDYNFSCFRKAIAEVFVKGAPQ